jgi:DNA-binding NarL/FixJ family response regulator
MDEPAHSQDFAKSDRDGVPLLGLTLGKHRLSRAKMEIGRHDDVCVFGRFKGGGGGAQHQFWFLLALAPCFPHFPANAMNKEILKGNSGHNHPIRVCLVEDDSIFRDKCQEWLQRNNGFHCIGSFGDLESALPVIQEMTPDIVALDYGLPGIRGSAAIRLLKRQAPSVRIIVVTGIPTNDVVFDSIEAGADGFADKYGISDRIFMEAIRATHAGEAPLSMRARKLVLEKLQRDRSTAVHWDELTDREKEVAHLLKTGLPNKEIARKLDISPATIHFHMKQIFNKLHVNDRVEAQFKLWGIGGGGGAGDEHTCSVQAGVMPSHSKNTYPFWVGDGSSWSA